MCIGCLCYTPAPSPAGPWLRCYGGATEWGCPQAALSTARTRLPQLATGPAALRVRAWPSSSSLPAGPRLAHFNQRMAADMAACAFALGGSAHARWTVAAPAGGAPHLQSRAAGVTLRCPSRSCDLTMASLWRNTDYSAWQAAREGYWDVVQGLGSQPLLELDRWAALGVCATRQGRPTARSLARCPPPPPAPAAAHSSNCNSSGGFKRSFRRHWRPARTIRTSPRMS